jgi:hypothetical protein
VAETVKIYPTTEAYEYWRNESLTSISGRLTAFGGNTSSNRYVYPLPFNLSAYKDKQMKSMKLFAQMTSDSNNFSSSEYIRAGITTVNTWSTAVDVTTGAGLDTVYQPNTANAFNEWNVAGAWNVLSNGAGYIMLGGNEYGAFRTNHANVAIANRPYILLEYEESTPHVKVGGVWRRTKGTFVRVGGTWRQVKATWVKVGGVWRLTK